MQIKRVYRSLIRMINGIGQNIRINKQIVSEYVEISKVNKSIPVRGKCLSKEQIGALQRYWKPLYGKKIPTKWHLKYYGHNDSFDVRYFPEIFYTTKLEPMMNKDRITDVLQDKSLIEILFARVLERNEDIVVPETIVGCTYGNCFDSMRNGITKEMCMKILSVLSGEYVVKPTIEGSAGQGVKLIDLRDGMDARSGIDIETIIRQYGNHFIVQKRIEQHPAYAKPHPSSINTIRIHTYRVNGEIKVAPAIMRIGANNSFLDNAHTGGVFVAIDQNGIMADKAYQYYHDSYRIHPNTGVVFGGHRLPGFEKILRAAKELHQCLPNIGFVCWDFAMDKNNKVVLVESNMSCCGIRAIQIAWGQGIYGEDTEYMIRLISVH